MKVLKFGGSSLETAERLRNVISIVSNAAERTSRLAVVCSAFGGVTDTLITIAQRAVADDEQYQERVNQLQDRHLLVLKELLPVSRQSQAILQVKLWFNDLEDVLQGVRLVGELSDRCLDYVMSFGELLSAYILTQASLEVLPSAQFLDAREVIEADSDFGTGKVNFAQSFNAIQAYFQTSGSIVFTTGFIAATPRGETVTLGRGGSDYTASIIGAALSAEEIEIWTDVDGIMTADPRKVAKAFPQTVLTYEEAMELSHFGAKVIYPPTMLPALEKQIPIRVLNTFNNAYQGTVVAAGETANKYPITGISSIPHIALIRVAGGGMVGVAGISKRLFTCLANRQVNIILISQASSEHSICFAVHPADVSSAKEAIQDEFETELARKRIREVTVEEQVSIVSIVGENMRKTPGVSARAFQALGKNGVNIVAIAQGSSELNISTVVAASDERKALNALHEEFFFPETKAINIFLVGVGLIGGKLLEQIADHAANLEQEHAHQVHIVGIANSSGYVIDRDGIRPDSALAQLQAHNTPGTIRDFVSAIKELNILNSVFVDCTANQTVCSFYPELLDASISVVTPNKKAQSATLSEWKTLLRAGRPRGVEFLFETSVGAGLPVISTLNDLLRSGDRVRKIEAVLSGTLSYIFNSFDNTTTFSEVVIAAREQGYTEPDPRDDLNGLDVARKILILARVVGLELELDDVSVENLVPIDCRESDSVEQFLLQLAEHDATFEQRRRQASDRGAKLCYIATLADGTATVSLEEVDAEHPFYTLSGSDNIVSFTSDRYQQRPLVVKGPGAGAAVTAAGVFADLIRIAS